MYTQNSIKLISLNIEMNKHLDTVIVFLQKEKPDVVCLQEVSEYDFPRLQEVLGMEGRYEPMLRVAGPRPDRALAGGTVGLGLFSRFPSTFVIEYYSGDVSAIPREQDDNQGARGTLLQAEFFAWEKEYVVGTTHFTWTPNGEASPEQRTDMDNLLSILSKHEQIVFCGDFNAPRGREMWGKIASQYKDNIPPEYISSVDPLLHRAKGLEVMVDGLFSTPEYRVSDVRLVEGVSDHKAVVGTIEKIN
ncbi:MAG: endonuclease/exonuclease/phosphatase family protein [bacterium]|nr:endonuclease/exonuclease/phosphatase family protein [bacterium]